MRPFIQTIDKRLKIKRDRFNEISIKSLSEQYESKGFIRVHRSFLVNFNYIYKINRTDIVLKNGISISINPHKVNEIKNIYQEFLMNGV